MKKIYLLLSLFFSLNFTDAQISGDTAVCAGNFYTYSANILNADSFYWTTPAGWYNMQGQGTSQITVNCNVNAGDVCVEGFDSLGVSLGVMCLTTNFGGGGPGWKASTPTTSVCTPQFGSPVLSIDINPDTTGGGGCGICMGVANTNIVYAVYSGVWPNGVFLGLADGNNFNFPFPPGNYTLYIYEVDILNGTNPPQAVRIMGGGCGGTISNSVNVTVVTNMITFFSMGPFNGFCVGTPVNFQIQPIGLTSIGLSCTGCTYQNLGFNVIVTPTTTNWILSGTGYISNCFLSGSISGQSIICSIQGDGIICAGKTYSYHANFPSGNTTYAWTVPSGWYNLTGQGTSTISVTANNNSGNVCCSYGYSFCLNTQFGDGASEGWSISPDTIHRCISNTAPFTAQVLPNGTGGGGNCPVGCGNGVQHPNIVYAVYDSIWPNGNFVGVADGVSPIPFFAGSAPYYVYEMDTTDGVNPPQAILISGGCNVGTKNNIITHDTIAPLPSLTFNPTTVCLDSLITISSNDSLINLQWTVSGGTIISNNGNSIVVQATAMQLSVSVSGIDSVSTCAVNGTFNVPVNYCAPVSLLGDQTVCAGYTYSYNVNMPHAVSYNWTLPAGWYNVTGQNTSQINATVNSNAGMISVTGFDSTGYALDSVSINTGFKMCRNKYISPSNIKTCKTDSIKAKLKVGVFGTGSCGISCGNGTQHANIAYAVYDDVFPNGIFRGFADSIQNISPVTATGNLYVYQVDYTNGTDAANAILISGECGGCNFANVISIDTTSLTTSITKTPAIACVGDTITLTENNNALNPYWDNAVDLNLLSQNANPVTAIITGINPAIDFTGIDSLTGCLVLKTKNITLPQQCFFPVASFSSNKTAFCEKQYVDFFDNTANSPTSWNWTFYWGSPSTSTLQNPDSIYYNQYGSFDVKLISCNGLSCDTLMLTNYITVYPSPPIPVITGNSGTMYSSPAVAYAWYSTSNPTIILSTDSFYVPTQLGDYFVIITDSNGCNSASTIFTITSMNQFNEDANFVLAEISQNIFEINFLCSTTGKLFISDAQGRILFKDEIQKGNQFKKQLDLSNFSKGIYLLNVQCGNKMTSRKLVVM